MIDMTEAMAIESIAEEYVKLLGYLTETRVPFKFRKGNSDIDVLAFHPKTKKTLVIECKAWGSPDQYDWYSKKHSDLFKDEFEKMSQKWDWFKKSPTNKWGFSVADAFWLVIPGNCEQKAEIEDEVSKELEQPVRIVPIHELMLDVMLEVKKDKDIRRKRYANPALEFCRWILRSYEHGHFNLIDLDLRLKGAKQTYDLLKVNYAKECFRAVKRNVEKRKAGVNTRINTLHLLMKVGKSTILELKKRAKNGGYDLNYSRIDVGLGTWVELGIVCKNEKGEFFIADPFKSALKQILAEKQF